MALKSLKDINWNQLYYFYEVAKNGSMKKAAKVLNITQPTVSDQIKKFEEHLGIKLFKRMPRQLLLTNEGSSLFVRSKDIFESGRKLLDVLSPISIGGYSANIGIKESLIMFSAINFISDYWDVFAEFGTVNTHRMLLDEDLIKSLLLGRLDWGITSLRPNHPRIAFKKFRESELLFCCSEKLFSKFKNKKDIVRNIPFVQTHWDERLNSVLTNYMESEDALPSEIIDIDHPGLILNLVQKGRCVSVADENVINSLKDFHVAGFRLSKKLKRSYYAVWLKGSEKMIALKKLLECIEKANNKDLKNNMLLQINASGVPSNILDEEYE